MDDRQSRVDVGTVVGPYRLRRRLGEGAAGVVWLAAREDDGELVALKLLRAAVAADDTARRRFAREARAAAEVHHPHLVPLLDAGQDGELAWLATRYVDGRSLADRLAADGPLAVPAACTVVAEVADGLQALHERGLVHRDVKPANILLDAAGRAALADFGLAKGAVYSALTRPGQVLGTLAYMAPELIRGEPATPASDVYALACVAFEALTGAPPFAGRGVLALGLAHLQDEPPDAAAGRPQVPGGVGWTIRQALGKEPARRPPTAVAFATLLTTAARAAPG
jgi:serine/threonine protein kinase